MIVLHRELAVDLGTATTQVFVRGRGVILTEPSVAAVKPRSGDVVDIGRSALHLAEQSSAVELAWPLKSGAIEDATVARKYLTKVLRPYVGGMMERTRLLLSVPSTTTPMERRALSDAGKRAGASHVYLIEQTIAAALGGDLPVHEPVGSMIVVAGAGITEAAMLSLGSIVGIASVRAGSADIDAAIKQSIRRDYAMIISDRTAEDIKLALSHLATQDEQLLIEAPGRLAIDGSTVTALLERDEVRSAVDSYVERTLDAVRGALIQAPPELAQDLFSRGVHLAGGGAELGGLPEAITEAFGLPVHVLPLPDRAAICGAGKCLEAIDSLKSLFVGET